jgi:hypothetical protein
MDSAAAEQRIADLESRLKYAGYNDRARAQMIEIEAKEGLQAEKRAEAAIRAREAEKERMQLIQNEIITWVKSGKLVIECEGKKISSIKEVGIPCPGCKKTVPDSISWLLAWHEQIQYAGGDGIILQRGGGIFSHLGLQCRHCGEHVTIRAQYQVLE